MRPSAQGGGRLWAGRGPWFHRDAAGQVARYGKDGIHTGASGVVRYGPRHDLAMVALASMAAGAWAPLKRPSGFLRGVRCGRCQGGVAGSARGGGVNGPCKAPRAV